MIIKQLTTYTDGALRIEVILSEMDRSTYSLKGDKLEVCVKEKTWYEGHHTKGIFITSQSFKTALDGEIARYVSSQIAIWENLHKTLEPVENEVKD